MPATVFSVPSSVTTATGFLVQSSAGGAGTYGSVSWSPTGHAVLTAAGISALASQCASYHGALSSVTNGEQIRLGGPSGSYAVLNADLAVQQAAIVTILANASNVAGKAS